MNAPATPILRWLTGPVVALAGVACVRGLAPLCAGRAQAVVLVTGYLLVPVGLGLYAAALGRRAAQRAAANPGPRA